MSTLRLPERAIVVSIDGSGAAHGALGWAAREAAARAVPLVIGHAYPAPEEWRDGELAGAKRNRAWRTAVAAARTVELEAPGVQAHPAAIAGSTWHALTDAVAEPELYVLGNHGRYLDTLRDLLNGSDPESADRPVVVVPRRGYARREPDREPGPVVVGVVPTEPSDAALRFATTAAETYGRPLLIVELDSYDGAAVTRAAQRAELLVLPGRASHRTDTLRRVGCPIAFVPTRTRREPAGAGTSQALAQAQRSTR